MHCANRLDSRGAGHIHEDDVGAQGAREVRRLRAVLGFPDDLHIRLIL